MSDTEEPFDKEAEKEKLREQLRREEEARRTTQHMSDLLLKGATMTNKHCDTCGDPLFRHEGREFCPTCSQGEATATESSGQPSPAADADEPSGIDRVATGSDTAPSGTEAPRGPDRSAPVTAERDVDLDAARATLVRKLTALARQAEATEDVGRSRELLAAAREAAEALAAVDSVRR